MSIRRALLAVVPLVLAAGGAPALTVTGAATAPVDGVLLSRDVAGDAGSYLCDRGIGTASQIGQTFRLEAAADLTRVTLRARPETEVAGHRGTCGTCGDCADSDASRRGAGATTTATEASGPAAATTPGAKSPGDGED